MTRVGDRGLTPTELCRQLIDEPTGLTWSCSARVDTVDLPLLQLMKKAGCWEISYGLESGSDEMLEKMGKVTRVAI